MLPVNHIFTSEWFIIELLEKQNISVPDVCELNIGFMNVTVSRLRHMRRAIARACLHKCLHFQRRVNTRLVKMFPERVLYRTSQFKRFPSFDITKKFEKEHLVFIFIVYTFSEVKVIVFSFKYIKTSNNKWLKI